MCVYSIEVKRPRNCKQVHRFRSQSKLEIVAQQSVRVCSVLFFTYSLYGMVHVNNFWWFYLQASFVFGNLTTSTTATTTTPTSLPSLDETVTSNFESLEFSPTEISAQVAWIFLMHEYMQWYGNVFNSLSLLNFAQNPKCSPGGYPCTPDIVKMKLRNNSMYTSKAYQEPTPCCSGVCQYEEGWIDATCE